MNGHCQARTMPEHGPAPTEQPLTSSKSDRIMDLRARAEASDSAAAFNLGWCLAGGQAGRAESRPTGQVLHETERHAQRRRARATWTS